MKEQNNSYNQNVQQPQSVYYPPTYRPMHRPQGYGRRMMPFVPDQGMPKWVSSYAIGFYIAASLVITFAYSAYSMAWYYMLSGIVAVLSIFLWGRYQMDKWSTYKVIKERNFEKKLFWLAFLPRLAWMILIYVINMNSYEDAFGFENGDAVYYDELAQFVASLIKDGNFHFYDEISHWSNHNDISDMGYGIYAGFVYWLTGSGGEITTNGAVEVSHESIIALRLIKCILSSITVLLIYRLAKRNFDQQTARMAAIFVALWPNFWYYCGTHLKETEMVFLGVLFVEQADQMLRSKKFTAWKVIPVLLIGTAIFGFRTPLAVVAFLAILFTVVMSSTKVVSWGKRILVGLLAIVLIGVTMGNRLEEQSKELIEKVQSDQQKENMTWRSEKKQGNSFAKYAGATVFAPMIFTLPFPSMVRPFEGQEVQQLLNGGNFVKNIISCFTIFAMIMLLISGKWRDHLLPLSFMLGYLVVLTMSSFAHSERFHQPVMPFEFMFAAYGLSLAMTKKKYKRWYLYWCVLMFVAALAWNWFKLKGRGLQ